MDTAKANAKMRPSIRANRLSAPGAGRRGNSAGATASSTRSPVAPRNTPATPPAKASSRLSVSNCRRIATAPGADRDTDGDLLAASGGAHQQKVGDVRAGDQQDEGHGSEEDEQRRL